MQEATRSEPEIKGEAAEYGTLGAFQDPSQALGGTWGQDCRPRTSPSDKMQGRHMARIGFAYTAQQNSAKHITGLAIIFGFGFVGVL